jgi:hypothetical protein
MAVAGIRRALVPSRDGRDGKSSKSDELHYWIKLVKRLFDKSNWYIFWSIYTNFKIALFN